MLVAGHAPARERPFVGLVKTVVGDLFSNGLPELIRVSRRQISPLVSVILLYWSREIVRSDNDGSTRVIEPHNVPNFPTDIIRVKATLGSIIENHLEVSGHLLQLNNIVLR